MPTPRFEGVIGDDWRTSTPWWPPRAGAAGGRAERGAGRARRRRASPSSAATAPTSTPRPSTRWPPDGVRLTNFHTTALCSPTRACLLTGRNHHRNGMGRVADLAVGYPGYNGEHPEGERLPLGDPAASTATPPTRSASGTSRPTTRPTWRAPRALVAARRGASTAGTGSTAARPTSSCRRCTTTTTRSPPPRTVEEGYHLSEDLADRAIEYLGDLRAVDADQPFFLYFCHRRLPLAPPGAAGVDRALPRPLRRGLGRVARGDLRPPAGDGPAPRRHASCRRGRRGCRRGTTLPTDEQRVAARFMECFAAFLSYTDAQIGRLLDFLDETGELDNTLVVLVSDNGASAEGGPGGSINDAGCRTSTRRAPTRLRGASTSSAAPRTHNNYPWGWTMAGNTPFKRWKREVHEGGVADPCIVDWPARRGRAAGEVRRQFAHAVDIAAHRARAGRRRGPRGHRRTCRRRRSTASASPACSAPTAGRARAPHHPVLRDVRQPRRSTTTAGRR